MDISITLSRFVVGQAGRRPAPEACPKKFVELIRRHTPLRSDSNLAPQWALYECPTHVPGQGPARPEKIFLSWVRPTPFRVYKYTRFLGVRAQPSPAPDFAVCDECRATRRPAAFATATVPRRIVGRRKGGAGATSHCKGARGVLVLLYLVRGRGGNS